jgi:hypothetical protein
MHAPRSDFAGYSCVTRNFLIYKAINQNRLQITNFNDYACVTHNHKGSTTLRKIAAVPIMTVSHVSFRPVIRCSRMAVLRPRKVCARFKRCASASTTARQDFRPPESRHRTASSRSRSISRVRLARLDCREAVEWGELIREMEKQKERAADRHGRDRV